MARGILAAAVSANVQPLAILARQGLGSTLAVSAETIYKIELVVLRSPQTAAISFLKGYVSFILSDCSSQLGTSAATIRTHHNTASI